MGKETGVIEARASVSRRRDGASRGAALDPPGVLAGADGDADDEADDEAEPKGSGHGLAGAMADNVLGHLIALAGVVGGLAVGVAEALAGIDGEVAGPLGSFADRPRYPGGQRVEEPLDR